MLQRGARIQVQAEQLSKVIPPFFIYKYIYINLNGDGWF